MDEYTIIENAITALAAAIPTALLTAHFSIKKYRTDKWWDHKLTCYFDTITAINDLILYCDSVIDMEYKEIDYSSKEIKSLRSKFHEARLHIQAQANMGRILFAKDAYKALFDLNNKMFSAERESDLVQRMAAIREVADQCMHTITTSTEKDLSVKSWIRHLALPCGTQKNSP